jgi:hypothetical protein
VRIDKTNIDAIVSTPIHDEVCGEPLRFGLTPKKSNFSIPFAIN